MHFCVLQYLTRRDVLAHDVETLPTSVFIFKAFSPENFHLSLMQTNSRELVKKLVLFFLKRKLLRAFCGRLKQNIPEKISREQ